MLLSNKTVLVTGGAGFIGSHIVDRALELGAEKVTVVDNFVNGKKDNISHLSDEDRFALIEGDVTDFSLMRKLVSASDHVFHEAASKMVVSLDRPMVDLNTNIVGTFNILEAARDSGVRIVHASTGSVFGSSERPLSEDVPKKPTSFYGVSKLAGEGYCQLFAKELGVKVSIIRYFHVFGPRQDFSGEAGVVSIFLSRVLRGEPPIVHSGGNQVRCFTFVDDVVDATMLLAGESKSIGKPYNVASKTRMTINELADVIIARYSKIPLKPIAGSFRYGENFKPIPDTSEIESFGFSAKTGFDEGLEITKKWVEKRLG